jgi:hypothetical protein
MLAFFLQKMVFSPRFRDDVDEATVSFNLRRPLTQSERSNFPVLTAYGFGKVVEYVRECDTDDIQKFRRFVETAVFLRFVLPGLGLAVRIGPTTLLDDATGRPLANHFGLFLATEARGERLRWGGVYVYGGNISDGGFPFVRRTCELCRGLGCVRLGGNDYHFCCLCGPRDRVVENCVFLCNTLEESGRNVARITSSVSRGRVSIAACASRKGLPLCGNLEIFIR